MVLLTKAAARSRAWASSTTAPLPEDSIRKIKKLDVRSEILVILYSMLLPSAPIALLAKLLLSFTLYPLVLLPMLSGELATLTIALLCTCVRTLLGRSVIMRNDAALSVTNRFVCKPLRVCPCVIGVGDLVSKDVRRSIIVVLQSVIDRDRRST